MTDQPERDDDQRVAGPGFYVAHDLCGVCPFCDHPEHDAHTDCPECVEHAQLGEYGPCADLTPDALLLLTDPATVDPGYRESNAAQWGAALALSAAWRRRQPFWPTTELRAAVAASGLVPDPADPDAAQRQWELGDAWGKAQHARMVAEGHDPDHYESSDGWEERELLAGRWPAGRPYESATDAAYQVAGMTRYHRAGADLSRP